MLVFSSARQIRSFSQAHKGELFKACTLEEFFKRTLSIKNRVRIGTDLQKLILKEALQTHQLAFEDLGFNFHFKTFFEDSALILNFLNEVATAQVDFCTIDQSDIYAEFSKHIKLLQMAGELYEKALEQKGFYDDISLKKNYQLNTQYISSLKEIHFFIEGFLNHFEIRVLKQIAHLVHLKITFLASSYNQEAQARVLSLKELCKVEIVQNKKSYGQSEVIVFEDPFCEAGAVFGALENMINQGASPSKLAVVICNKNAQQALNFFDRHNNLNYAFGWPFSQTLFYKHFKALCDFQLEPCEKNRKKIEKYNLSAALRMFTTCTKMSALTAFLERFSKNFDKDTQGIVQKVLQESHFLRDFNLGGYELYFYLDHFFKRESLNDVKGGKITVCEPMEVRGIEFDGIVLLDFNEEDAIDQNSNDFLLNNSIRERAGLLTIEQKRQLQISRYDLLFKNSAKIAIFCLDNEQKTPCTLLNTFGFTAQKYADEERFLAKLNQGNAPIVRQNIAFKYSDIFKKNKQKPLNPTAISMLKTNTYKFYYEYMLDLKPPKINATLIEDAATFGQRLHAILHAVYKDGFLPQNKAQLQRRFLQKMQEILPQNILKVFYANYYEIYMQKFFDHEINHLKKGFVPTFFEYKLQGQIQSINFTGIVDRVDKKKEEFYIIDYKLSDGQNDFQPYIYRQLFSQDTNQNVHFGYYNLKRGELKFLNEKKNSRSQENTLELLQKILTHETIPMFCRDPYDKAFYAK